jgi:predicted metallo-beta-lactamase superfamily hydrolase
MNKNQKLNVWIALNVTKTLRRITDEEYAEVLAWANEANEEPHPNMSLTQPYRFVGCCPNYTTNAASAMQVLEHCMKNLDQLTGRTDFQIVVLYDTGNDKPFCVVTNSAHDKDDSTHVRNCAAAETMELAICLFAEKLHKNRRVAEPANDRISERADNLRREYAN